MISDAWGLDKRYSKGCIHHEKQAFQNVEFIICDYRMGIEKGDLNSIQRDNGNSARFSSENLSCSKIFIVIE